MAYFVSSCSCSLRLCSNNSSISELRFYLYSINTNQRRILATSVNLDFGKLLNDFSIECEALQGVSSTMGFWTFSFVELGEKPPHSFILFLRLQTADEFNRFIKGFLSGLMYLILYLTIWVIELIQLDFFKKKTIVVIHSFYSPSMQHSNYFPKCWDVISLPLLFCSRLQGSRVLILSAML